MSHHYSIIIPTYNESDNIVLLINRIKTILRGFDFEIIVIDDRSEDGTYSLVNETYEDEPNIRCYYHQGPRSLGASILEGIRKAAGDVIIGMDADFNHDPCLLPMLIESLDKYDFVVASRFVKGGGMENRLSYMLSLFFNLSLRLFFSYPIYDNTSGYYAIKKSALVRLQPEKIYYGYGEYHLRLVYFSYKAGLSIGEVPVWYENRRHGYSKSNYCKMMFSYFYTAYLLKRDTRNINGATSKQT